MSRAGLRAYSVVTLEHECSDRYGHAVLTLLMILGMLVARGMAAQELPDRNPFEGDPEAIRAGMGGFRQRCADCHGTDARGVRGPDITQVWASGRTDQGLFMTIRQGVTGTEMPGFTTPRTSDRQIWEVLAYLRTLAAPAPKDLPQGNAKNGARIFESDCAGCHRVGAGGGRLGPDLSRIGAARSREALVQLLRRGAEDFRPGFAPVTVTPRSGPPIQGLKKNEDLFSVQIMDTSERIQGFVKDEVSSVVNGKLSAMPVFRPEYLSDSDLDDLVRYLQTLRGFNPAVQN